MQRMELKRGDHGPQCTVLGDWVVVMCSADVTRTGDSDRWDVPAGSAQAPVEVTRS